MRVDELRAILAVLPEDLPVLVVGNGTPLHVGVVEKEPSGSWPRTTSERHCETGRCRITEHENVAHGQYLVIRPPNGYGSHGLPGRIDPAPPFRLAGQWPRKKALAAALDALNPLTAEPAP